MSFTSYTNFRTEVSNWLDVSDVTTTSLDSIIQMGERYVFRKLRVSLMESSLAVTINSLGTATLPADYIDCQFAYLDTSPTLPLTKKPAEWIFRTYADRASTGNPAFYAETNRTFIFGPAPDATDTVKGTYYARTMISTNSTVTSLFSEYPEIFLWAALANAELFLGRDQRMAWQQKCDEAIYSANKEDKRKKFSGGPVHMSPG